MKKLLALLVSLVVFAALLEGGARLAGLGPSPRINRFHATLGWEKTPGLDSRKKTSEFDITFAVNAKGLRGRDLPYEKPPGEVRIAFVGDSFCLGYTVDESDLFVEIVGERLRARGARVAVVNGGTEGYSTDQEALWFRDEGLRYAPDVAVLCFYPNDVFWSGERNYLRYPKPLLGEDGRPTNLPLVDPGRESWFASRTAIGKIVGALRDPIPTFRPSGAGRPVPKEEGVFLVEEPDFVAAAWARVRASIALFQASARSAGVATVALAIPHKIAVHADAAAAFADAHDLETRAFDADLPTRRFLEACAASGVTAVDPTARLRAAAAEGRRLYYEKDWHLTPDGNRTIADLLEETLVATEPLRGVGPAVAATAPEAGGTPSRRPRWPFVVGALWILLTAAYAASYRDEPRLLAPVKVALFLALVVGIFFGVAYVSRTLPWLPLLGVAALLGFVVWKSAGRLRTMAELLGAFAQRGHWYMLPLLAVMVSIGTLLVVAASSPFVAPFIYTLF